MKVIDSMWFNSMQGSFGFVVGENEMGERKLYAGVISGFDQKADEQAILSWGNEVNIRIMEALIAKTKKSEAYNRVTGKGGNMLEKTITAKMSEAHMSYQKLADAIGENDTTVQRAVKKPLSARASILFKILRHLGIGWDHFADLFAKEVDG